MGRIRNWLLGAVAGLAVPLGMAHAATGDVLGVTIDSTGLFATIRLDDLSANGEGAYDFVNKPPVFTVVSQGFTGSSLGTVTRTVKGVRFKAESILSGDLYAQVWLDAPVFQDDKYVMGSMDVSGTDPTLTVQAGWVTGGTAATSYAVTNNSGLAYPKVIAHWFTPPCRYEHTTWKERVVAFGNQPDATYPFGITRVTIKVQETSSGNSGFKEIDVDSPTMIARDGTLGPADQYAVWEAEFDADNRTGGSPGTAFAQGTAERTFTVYPRIGDTKFESATATTSVLEIKNKELYLDPSSNRLAEHNRGEVWVDSSFNASGSFTSGSFEEGEWVIGSTGSSPAWACVVSSTSSTIKLAKVNKATFYTMDLSALTGGGTPQYGDIVRAGYSSGGSDHRAQGMVVKYEPTPRRVTYLLISTENFNTNTSSTGLGTVQFYRESSMPTPVIAAGTVTTGPGSAINTNVITNETASFTGLKNGGVFAISGGVPPSAAGVDGLGRGDENTPLATISYAIARAQELRYNNGSSPNIIDGCTIYLRDGDYLLGTRTNNNSPTSDRYFALITKDDNATRSRVRIVGSEYTQPGGIGVTRAKFENVTIRSITEDATVYSDNGGGSTNDRNLKDVVWFHNCSFVGAGQVVAGAFVGGTGYEHEFYTSCSFTKLANPLDGNVTVRDCAITLAGGDITKTSRAVLNLDISDCNTGGDALAHGDVAQFYVPSSTTTENVIWFNVRTRRIGGSIHPAPNANNFGTFENAAFVNMLQGSDGQSAPNAFLGVQTMNNILLWNYTLDDNLEMARATIPNLSVRACMFGNITHTNTSFRFVPADTWYSHFRANDLADELVHGSMGGTDRWLFFSTDNTHADFYRPVNNGTNPLHGFSAALQPVGHDVFGDDYTVGTIGAVATPSTGTCGPQDFNGDGDDGTDQDIEAFFACVGNQSSCCTTCWSPDFNGDGDVGTDQDIEAFFRVLNGGTC